MSVNVISQKKRFIFVLILAFVIQAGYLIFNPLHQPISDFFTYDVIASNILAGNGFSIDGVNPVSTYPLYPVFLSLIYKIFGHNYFIVQLFLSIFLAITCGIIYLIGKTAFNEKVSLFTAAFVSIYPPFFGLSRLMFTEPLFLMFLYAAILLLIFFIRTHRVSMLFAGGIFLGLAILTRPHIVYFPLVIAILFFWRFPFKGAFLYMAILYLGILLCMAPWISRNYIIYKDFRPITGFAIGYGKIKKIDGQSVYKKENSIRRLESQQQELIKRYYAKAKIEPRIQIKNNLLQKAINYFASDYVGNPTNGIDLLRRLYVTSYGDVLDIGIPFKVFAQDINIIKSYWYFLAVKIMLILVSSFIFLFGVIGMISNLKQGIDINRILLVSLFASYTLFFYLWVKFFGQVGICGRYGIPVLPILILFAVDMFARIKNKLIDFVVKKEK
jgi:4-amino-4-deoxy-L-arabinose transferase-like glycosyltransferase